MASTSAARADRCAICGTWACQGDCSRCHLRLKGECGNMHIARVIDGVWRWVCAECYLKEHTKKG